MPKNKEREYRKFKIEIKEDPDPDYHVRGYASKFNEYTLFSFDGVDYNERIEPNAFDEADMSDVIFLYNHEGMVYARKKNGTLTVEVDEVGLLTDADLSSTEQSRQMYDAIRTGLVDQMSFAFTVDEDEYEETDKTFTRIIKRIGKVYDVSAVSIPANPDTDISAISARSAFDGAIERKKAERLEREKQLEIKKKQYFYI